MKYRFAGFTMVEIIISVLIIGILAAIAVPSYTSHLRKSRRSDAQIAVLDLASKMDQYYTENNTYSTATLTTIGASASSPQGYYALSIPSPTATTFTVTATIDTAKAQNGDTCKTFTINELGVKGGTNASNTALTTTTSPTLNECWNQ